MKQTLNVIARESGAERLTTKQWLIVVWWVASVIMATAEVESVIYYVAVLVNFLWATYHFKNLPFTGEE